MCYKSAYVIYEWYLKEAVCMSTPNPDRLPSKSAAKLSSTMSWISGEGGEGGIKPLLRLGFWFCKDSASVAWRSSSSAYPMIWGEKISYFSSNADTKFIGKAINDG